MLADEIKRLSKNSIGFSLGKILPKAIGFFLIPVYTRFLTPEDYGILEIANVTLAILTIIYLSGQIGSLQRFYYDYYKDKRKFQSYMGTIIGYVLGFSLVVTIILNILGKPVISQIFHKIPFYPYLFIIIWTAFFKLLFPFPQRLLQVREKSFSYSFLSVTQFLVSLGFIIYFVVVKKQGALGSIKGNFIATVIFFIISCFLLRNDFRFSLDSSKLKESLSFGLPLVPHALAGWILTFVDRIFLTHFTSLEEVGLYSLGYKFGMILSIIVTSINFAWMPFFISTAKERPDIAKGIFRRITTFYIAFILLLGLGVSIFAREIIVIMATPKFFDSHRVIPIIVFTYVFQGLYYMVVNQIFFTKKTRFLPIATVGAAIINVGFNLLFIPRWGMMGAAWATLISFVFMFVFTWFISKRVYPIDYEYGRIIELFAITGALFTISLFLPDYSFGIMVLIKSGLIILYPVILFVSGFFSKEEIAGIKYIFKKENNSK